MKQVYVQLHQDRITTTSLIIAEMFDKRHDNVLKDIKGLDCSEEFKLLNFEEAFYKGDYPYYFVTRDGFSFLAMGYTGAKAAGFKEAFIKAFNRMEHALRVATTPILLPVYQKRVESEAARGCPDNRWCIFNEAQKVMFWIEKEIGCINEYDLVDGSIGAHWVKYREGKSWRSPITHYWHEFEDKRGKRLSNCYEYTELEHFKVWLKQIYMKEHLYPYLHSKYKSNKLMLQRVKAAEPKLIDKRK